MVFRRLAILCNCAEKMTRWLLRNLHMLLQIKGVIIQEKAVQVEGVRPHPVFVSRTGSGFVVKILLRQPRRYRGVDIPASDTPCSFKD